MNLVIELFTFLRLSYCHYFKRHTLFGDICKYFLKEISTLINCSSCSNVKPVNTGQWIRKFLTIQFVIVIYCSLEGNIILSLCLRSVYVCVLTSRWQPLQYYLLQALTAATAPHWGAADAGIKVPSGENTELKRSPFEAWSRSVYSHTCYAYCQGFLPCLFLPFRSIYLHFYPKPLPISPVLAVANTCILCRPAE